MSARIENLHIENPRMPAGRARNAGCGGIDL